MPWSTLVPIILIAVGLVATGTCVQHVRRGCIGAGLVFLGCVVAFHLVPLLGFIWPLLSVRGGVRGWHNILSLRTAWQIDALQWGLATIIFMCIAKRAKAVFLLPLSLAMIATVSIIVHIVVRQLGMNFYWDWWR